MVETLHAENQRSLSKFQGGQILGTGIQFGGRAVSAAEIDTRTGKRSGWTAKHTGVLNRHFVKDGESASTLGATAVGKALAVAGLGLGDVDALICASGGMQQPIPSTSSLILKELGPEAIGMTTFDLNSTCLSFVTAFDMASCLLKAGRFNCVIIVSTEVASCALNWNEAESAGLMADGAAAVILGGESSVHASLLKTYPAGSALAEIRGGGTALPATHFHLDRLQDYLFSMEGRGVFRMAMKYLPPFYEELFASGDFDWDDVDLVIPHQASTSALRIMRRRLGIAKEKYFVNVQQVGNTVAAAIPIALHQAIESGQLERGMKVLLTGTSAGFSIGAIYFTY
ncbi:beta-ketoacyl-ACP synthase III [bacterium]|nr:beta-ketoacyl-ACP synthase III [bacterium]